MYSARQFPICPDCQMKRVKDEVKDPEYKFLNVDEELLRKSSFLRSIKEQYLYKGTLSEKQIETFKKVVKEMGEGEKKEEEIEKREKQKRVQGKVQEGKESGIK